MTVSSSIWIFMGAGAKFPSGAFSSLEKAEAWVTKHALSGVLTLYPIDAGAYDWAVEQGFFKPKKDAQREAAFVGRFSSASQEHHHYEDGRRA